tara:strand:+ start:258 stop:554 length:297 start_codon:yes stop_codon:yes gene_type:complete
MEYKILFYVVITIFFIIALTSLVVHYKGGSTTVLPISGVGILFGKSKVKMYDEQANISYISNKITMALVFILILFEWEDGAGTPGDEDDSNNLVHNGN